MSESRDLDEPELVVKRILKAAGSSSGSKMAPEALLDLLDETGDAA